MTVKVLGRFPSRISFIHKLYPYHLLNKPLVINAPKSTWCGYAAKGLTLHEPIESLTRATSTPGEISQRLVVRMLSRSTQLERM